MIAIGTVEEENVQMGTRKVGGQRKGRKTRKERGLREGKKRGKEEDQYILCTGQIPYSKCHHQKYTNKINFKKLEFID